MNIHRIMIYNCYRPDHSHIFAQNINVRTIVCTVDLSTKFARRASLLVFHKFAAVVAFASQLWLDLIKLYRCTEIYTEIRKTTLQARTVVSRSSM